MATEDNTHISRTFTSQELHSLADRMFSRGIVFGNKRGLSSTPPEL
jgi:hypothetical protein